MFLGTYVARLGWLISTALQNELRGAHPASSSASSVAQHQAAARATSATSVGNTLPLAQ